MRRHLPFQPFIIWSAILLGVAGGFSLGAHMVYVLAFSYPVGPSFAAMIQVHGHLQLLGWTGLFIIGISLYKLPRLMSEPLRRGKVPFIAGSIVSGLILKSASQLMPHYGSDAELCRIAHFIGGILESAGIAVYFGIMFPKTIRFKAQAGAIAAASMKPFLLVSQIGWAAYATLNGMLGWFFLVQRDHFLLDSFWNGLSTDVYIHLVLIPTCLAFSIGTFPIFLRLRAPMWRVGQAAVLYFAGAAIALAGAALETPSVAAFGVVCRGAAVLWTVYEMDLFRRHDARKQNARAHPESGRMPRARAGDYGQFGNFEWLIYAAYVWLAVAVLLELSNALATPITSSLVRHYYLLGFVTHLILGMAVRLVPGFLGVSRIAYPHLVRLSFVLITASLLGRTLPQGLALMDIFWLRSAYGLSGAIGMLALLALGINLMSTVRRFSRETAHAS